MRRFSDFARSEVNLEGEKVKVESILDKELTVLAYRTLHSKFFDTKELAQVQLLIDGVKCVIFTASEALISQLRQYEAEIPFTATIHKEGRYYTFK